jgi:hypothetical protein
MPLDYETRLRNLQNRRYDQDLHESVLTKSFSSTSIPKNVKYLMESMQKIDKKYNQKTLEAANKVQTHLVNGLNLNFTLSFRTQGSVMTSTNIKVHSDFDLLTIINRYHYVAPDLANENPYTESIPNSDIKALRKQSENILKSIYDIVNTEGKKSIYIFNKNLNRKVDVVFCFWYNTKSYEETNDEYYRGIYLFDFEKEEKILDFPFSHIYAVNNKGDKTNDGSRKAIRLLKTLKADNESINLNSFLITTIVHSIENEDIIYKTGNELSLAKSTSNQLYKLINNESYRESIESPNKNEKPLNSTCIKDMKILKEDLDQLIEDVQKELYNTYFEKGNLIYS